MRGQRWTEDKSLPLWATEISDVFSTVTSLCGGGGGGEEAAGRLRSHRGFISEFKQTELCRKNKRSKFPHWQRHFEHSSVRCFCLYVCSHACCRHCAAVALRSGCSSNMVNRKSLNSAAWSSGHSYFSNRTSNRPHGFKLDMWRSSPRTDRDRWNVWSWPPTECFF